MPQIAVLTPAGRGAVATIGIRGPRSIELVSRCVKLTSDKSLSDREPGSVALGRFALADAAEEVVVGLIDAEHVEVHCHGGVAAAQAVTDVLIAAGGEPIAWQEWPRGQSADPIAAAAHIELSQAPTERTAAILLDQYRGSLRRELAAIDKHIGAGDTAAATELLQTLLARSDVGLHLTRPWRAVIAGPPNAGKSSLVNALLGYQRAIVFAEPGTTRDVLTATTAFDGWPVELSDTAGLREAGDEIEAVGVERAIIAIQAADLTLFVADLRAAWPHEMYERVAATVRRVLIVHNKCDLAAPPDSRPAGIAISAKTGAGLDSLAAAIVASLAPSPPPAEAAVPFLPEQIAALHSALKHLHARDAIAARQALAQCRTPS